MVSVVVTYLYVSVVGLCVSQPNAIVLWVCIGRPQVQTSVGGLAVCAEVLSVFI